MVSFIKARSFAQKKTRNGDETCCADLFRQVTIVLYLMNDIIEFLKVWVVFHSRAIPCHSIEPDLLIVLLGKQNSISNPRLGMFCVLVRLR